MDAAAIPQDVVTHVQQQLILFNKQDVRGLPPEQQRDIQVMVAKISGALTPGQREEMVREGILAVIYRTEPPVA